MRESVETIQFYFYQGTGAERVEIAATDRKSLAEAGFRMEQFGIGFNTVGEATIKHGLNRCPDFVMAYNSAGVPIGGISFSSRSETPHTVGAGSITFSLSKIEKFDDRGSFWPGMGIKEREYSYQAEIYGYGFGG